MGASQSVKLVDDLSKRGFGLFIGNELAASPVAGETAHVYCESGAKIL